MAKIDTVIIPVTTYQGGKSGLSRFTENLINSLYEVNTNLKFVVYANSKAIQKMNLQSTEQVEIRKSILLEKFFLLDFLWHIIFCLSNKTKNKVLLSLVSRRVPFFSCLPVICYVHDLAALRVYNKLDPFRMYYHKNIIPWLLRRSYVKKLLAISETTKNDLIELYKFKPDFIKVTYNGVNFSEFEQFPKSESLGYVQTKFSIKSSNFIYFPSRIEHPNKNHVRLIEAFELLKNSGSYEGALVFSGALWSRHGDVLDKIFQSRYKNDIYYLGHVEKTDLSYLYSSTDLVVIPSLYEGFGLPVLEALCCGARVACSNTSSLGEIAPDFVNTFDPESVKNISETIVRSLASQSCAEKSIIYAKKFTWERFTDQLVNEVSSL